MPTAKELQYRRTHNLLLIQKLLNARENASPFTLVMDSLEQSGRHLVGEMMRRAHAAKSNVIYVSFETIHKPVNTMNFFHAFELSASAIQERLKKLIIPTSKNLIVFDTLYNLICLPNMHMPTFLSSFMSSSTSLLAVYHVDVPLDIPLSAATPHPLTLLKYLATTLFTTYSLHHIISQKNARDRAEAEPQFGLAEGMPGVFQGLGGNDPRGTVIEMEYRRKSGRAVVEWFFLPRASSTSSSSSPVISSTSTSAFAAGSTRSAGPPGRDASGVILLEDHPLYSRPVEEQVEEIAETTFSLGLTQKQRKDRDGVVLPYFDAQSGGGEGGRILYDMGVEDDFDEEEDEI